MSEVTRILGAVEKGDRQAANELLPLVYDELRNLAAKHLASEKPGQTLQATALVHEAYLRLVGPGNADGFEGRRHFFGAAAGAIRRILVDRARRKGRKRHGGGVHHVDLCDVKALEPDEELLALDEALDSLAAEDAEAARVVELRYFVGCSHEGVAEVLGTTVHCVRQKWNYARAWLRLALGK